MSEQILKAFDEGINRVQEKLKADLDRAMEKHAEDIRLHGEASAETKAEVDKLSKRFEETVTELTQKMDTTFARGEPEHLSVGAEFIKSEQFKALLSGNQHNVRFETKNTVTSGDTTVFPEQRPGVIPGDFAPLTIREMFRVIPVTTNMVNSLREASWVNSAAEVSQGAAKPESDITFEQYNVPITTVAHFMKVSNQLMQDAPAIMTYIDTRLRDGLNQRIDAQLLNGNGTSPNLSGLTDSGNFTAYTAASSDLLSDAINRAKYQLWAIGHMPDVVVVNPADWGAMERTRESAGSGQYLYGMPGSMAGMNPFGVRVVLSNHMAQGNFLIAAINTAAVLYARQGTTIEMGFVDKDFTNNLVTIRAETRLGLGVERPSAVLYGAFTA